MTNTVDIRAMLTKVALEHVPPMIRRTLLEETSFRQESGVHIEAVLSIKDSDISVRRSDLFKAVREVLSGSVELELTALNGQKWKLLNLSKDGELPSLALVLGEQHLILPSLAMLSPERSLRLRFFDETSTDVNLPATEKETWRSILLERPLDDEEVDQFHNDFRETPIEIAQLISKEIRSGEIEISTLVPHSRKYFERLIGTYDGSKSIREYASGNGKKILAQLSTWKPYDGFLMGLLLSSHSFITDQINVDLLSSGDLVRAYEYLDKHGDRISQVGAIEVGLRVLPTRPEIGPFVVSLISQILDENIDNQASGFNLLSTLFIFVDGELSQTRLLSSEPPFFRRLAALSQTALIHRELLNTSNDLERFSDWALKARLEPFFMQSLVDLRLEPRWHPDFASAAQMKADFTGRIINAANTYEQNIRSNNITERVLESLSERIQSPSDIFLTILPGPLEGVQNPHINLPTETTKAIEIQLGGKNVEPSSFIGLVNSAMIFSIDGRHADLASRILKMASHRLTNIESRSQLLTILNGLASVAAVARSPALADELKIIIREYRRDVAYELTIEEVMRVALVASSSHEKVDDWRRSIGDWLTELAFGDLKVEEGKILYSHLLCLLNADPELWVSCGRAEAALVAFNGS